MMNFGFFQEFRQKKSSPLLLGEGQGEVLEQSEKIR
jgi:hypothetical protein